MDETDRDQIHAGLRVRQEADVSGISDVRHRADLLTRPLRLTVFQLALPVLLQNFLSFCVGFFDTFLSGRIDASATSAIGVAAYVGWLASLLFSLVSVGTTALVARHWGAAKFDDANRVTNCSVRLAAIVGLLGFAGLYAAAPLVVDLLHIEGSLRDVVVNYLRVDSAGHLFYCLSLAGAAALRGTGDMRTPMCVIGMVNVLNVIVSTLLVYGPGPLPAMGVNGIVLGTLAAKVTGGLIMVLLLARGVSGLRLRFDRTGFDRTTVRRILRIGVPAAVDGSFTWVGQFLFLMIIARLSGGRFEGAVFAAHVIGVQLEGLTYLLAAAWGHASSTLVGQSLGASNDSRAFHAGHEAAKQGALLGAVITLGFFVGAGSLYSLMHNDPDVAEIGVPAFRMLAFFQVPLILLIVHTMSLHGAGDTRYPLAITTLGLGFVRLPLAYILGIELGYGLMGAWVGMCADLAVRAVLMAGRYQRKRWLKTTV